MSQPANPHQAIYNIAALCAAHGLTEVVLSPGSRCAPLTLAFARHPATNVRVVPDERAAAFIGLGIAQARRAPTVLVCTSGTAGLNYAPAVAEAFYQQVPLLILTADRPPEWIDQLDGQTIRQNGLYGAHVKGSYTFPTETTHPDARWQANRIINEAINLAKAYPPGPVHVNIPLREPLYPTGEVVFEEVRVVQTSTTDNSQERTSDEDAFDILDALENGTLGSKTLIVVGQSQFDHKLFYSLRGIKATILADHLSNLRPSPGSAEALDTVVSNYDSLLADHNQDDLRPTLLITIGLSVTSKNLKNFLRRNPPILHAHIQQSGIAPDPFKTLTHIIKEEPYAFFNKIYKNKYPASKPENPYNRIWFSKKCTTMRLLNSLLSANDGSFNELQALRKATHWSGYRFYPDSVHFANSMAVRYASLLSLSANVKGLDAFANRGTSGIDGCTSTAVGYALAEPDKQVVLLTGDVAFFYDRNAFWHNYPTPNLRVVLLNNHGGGIFRLIDGPRQQPELEEFFETRQALTAENLCRDFHLPYFPVDSMAKLEAALPVFFGPEGAGGVLEIQTDSQVNAAFFEEYRAAVKKAF